MATLKGIWTLGKKIQYENVGEQLINGILLVSIDGIAIDRIYVGPFTDDMHETSYTFEATYEGKDIFYIVFDSLDVIKTNRHYTWNFGDTEQTVSDEFYEWWTKWFIEYKPEQILGSWKISDEIEVGIVFSTAMTFEDSKGNRYDQIRKTTDDMGDTLLEAHNPDNDSWTAMFTIPW